MTNKTRRVGFLFGAAFAAGMVFAKNPNELSYVDWLGSVTEGVYTDAANWTGGVVPANGADGTYGRISCTNNDVRITAPAGGITENSGTVFLGSRGDAHTLTIDTRGSFWTKAGVTAGNNWWGSPFALREYTSHVFNFESLGETANTTHVWTLEDALFTWTSSKAAQEFELRSGTLLFGRHIFLGGSGEGGPVTFRIHPEASLVSTNRAEFQIRGCTGAKVIVLGGTQKFHDFYVKDQNANEGTLSTLVLTNDAAVSMGGSLYVAHRKDANRQQGKTLGAVELFGTSTLGVSGVALLGAGQYHNSETMTNLANQGALTLHDAATMSVNGATCVGQTQCSTGLVTIADNAALTTSDGGSGHVYLGYSSNAWGRVVVQDNGTLSCGGLLRPGYGRDSYGLVKVQDQGRVTVGLKTGNWLSLALGEGKSFGRLELGDDATLQLGDGASIELANNGNNAEAVAEIDLSGRAALMGGSSSILTNKCPTVGNSKIALADSATLTVKGLFGGVPATGAPATVFTANGGTLALPSNATPATPYLSGCLATLGANGLTLDTGVKDVTIDQDFAAADGATAAAFTKTGAGTLTVSRSSAHPRTVVSAGTLAFGAGVTQFGQALDFARGARLALTDAETAVTAASLAFDGALALEVPADLALDEAHALLTLETPLTESQLKHLLVANGASDRAYSFAMAADGTLCVTPRAVTTGGSATWTGDAGTTAWHAADNWEADAVPTAGDTVTVPTTVTIDVAEPATANALVAGDAATVALTGEGPLQPGTGATVPEGATLTLDVPLVGAGGTFTKTGSGALSVGGDNAASWFNAWDIQGGITTFTSAEALGVTFTSAGAITLGNNTLRYTGATPATTARALTFNSTLPALLDIEGDLTFDPFKPSFPQGDGALVKTGKGTLTLKVPSGTTTMSVGTANVPRKTNVDVNGWLVPSSAGETSGWDGAGQFSVLDGRVEIVGAGKSATTVRQEYHASLGGSGWNTTAENRYAELVLRDLAFTQGSGNGYHMLIDQNVRAGNKGSHLVLDGADMTCNGLYLGFGRASGNTETVQPVLAITNGTLNITWALYIPRNSDGFAPIVRVGRGGALTRNNAATPAGGIRFYKTVDARFEDGGYMEATSPQWIELDCTSADFAFTRGGGFKTTHLVSTSTKATLAFDGGFAAFTTDGGATRGKNNATVLRADAGGGELRVGEGVTHALTLPLTGEGLFTKTGAGTLVLSNDTTAVSSATVGNAGGLAIAGGTVLALEGTLPDGARVSGTGRLSGVAGALTVPVAAGATDGLRFEDLTVKKIVADFGVAADAAPLAVGTTVVVAKLADAAQFTSIVWKGANAGAGRGVTFACAADGVVTASVNSGCMVILVR